MQNGIDSEKLLDALDTVTWYNGLAELVLEWKNLPVVTTAAGGKQIQHQYRSLDGEQLEVIWMIAVSLFGDYGTSPRSGWITDVEGFYKFIDRITSLHREYFDKRRPI